VTDLMTPNQDRIGILLALAADLAIQDGWTFADFTGFAMRVHHASVESGDVENDGGDKNKNSGDKNKNSGDKNKLVRMLREVGAADAAEVEP